jgi:hypothetical protein
MGILFIYLYNGATGHARTGRDQPFTLFGGAFCAEMCQLLLLEQERRYGLLRLSPSRSGCFAYLSDCFIDNTNPQRL